MGLSNWSTIQGDAAAFVPDSLHMAVSVDTTTTRSVFSLTKLSLTAPPQDPLGIVNLALIGTTDNASDHVLPATGRTSWIMKSILLSITSPYRPLRDSSGEVSKCIRSGLYLLLLSSLVRLEVLPAVAV